MNPRNTCIFLLTLLIAFAGGISADSAPCSSLSANNQSKTETSGWQGQVNELNEKISLLRRWQEGYRMTADQAQFKADRLQFEENQLLDAKRLWKVAENANQKAQDLQVIIEKLENQRDSILKRHNQPIPKN